MKGICMLVAVLLGTACTTAESPKKQTVVCGVLDSLIQTNVIHKTVVKFSDGRRLILDAALIEITLTKGKIYSFTVENQPGWGVRGAQMHLVKTTTTNTCGYDKEGS